VSRLRILVLGSTGTVGTVLFECLSMADKWEVIGTTTSNAGSHDRLRFKWPEDNIANLVETLKPNVLINCVAKLNSIELETNYQLQRQADTLNISLPIALSQIKLKVRIIHLSTDAVFSGTNPPYDENSLTDGSGVYAKTKIAGEQSLKQSLIFRASILGRSKYRKMSIPNKIREASEDRKLMAPVNEYWNGVTTHAFGELVHSLLSNYGCSFNDGIQHLFTNDAVSKFELFRLVAENISHPTEIIESTKIHRPKSVILTTKNKQFLEDLWSNSTFKHSPTITEMLKKALL